MCLLPAAIHEVVVSALTVIAAEVEQIALLKKFTHYGGLQLESDVRQLFTYFSSLTSKSVRDKFTRLREISSFLSIEKVLQQSAFVYTSLWQFLANAIASD